MKTISTIFFFVLTHSLLFGQQKTNPAIDAESHKTHVCKLNYTENRWVINHDDNMEHQCDELLIASLPPMSQVYSPIEVKINLKGNYNLKKDPELDLSGEYLVEVEDLVTGEYYKLDSLEPYEFQVNRASGTSRFVLEVKKNKFKPVSNPTASK